MKNLFNFETTKLVLLMPFNLFNMKELSFIIEDNEIIFGKMSTKKKNKGKET